MNPKKAKWWNERAKALGGYATMESIHTNKSADIYYRKSATALLEAFLEATIKKIGKHYKSVYSFNADKGQSNIKSPAKVGSALKTIREYDLEEFKKQAEKIAEKFTMKVGRLSKKNIQDTLERFYGGRIPVRYNTNYNEILKLIIKRNVALLTKTAQQTLDNVENIVYDSMTTGKGWADIQGALKTQQGIAQRRIKLIARDQTAKATEAVNILMQRAAGAEYFEWRTAKDERVSTGLGGHKQLEGKIYKYGEENRYPVVNVEHGKEIRGLPAQRPNCRCTALSVFIMDGYKPEWSNADECYRIVRA